MPRFNSFAPMLALLCILTTMLAWAAPPDLNRSLRAIERTLPEAGEGHPGNVYLAGESVSVPPPGADAHAVSFRILDEAGHALGHGQLKEGEPVKLGKLEVGWYRIEFLDAAGALVGWTPAAVLGRLPRFDEPAPQDSPICVDIATAWFARDNAVKQEQFLELAALAGVNWARDRMSWGAVETARGVYAPETTSYDTSATLTAGHGLKGLQVFHSTPGWAIDAKLDGPEAWKRFPRDLRDQYRFCKAMAQRYEGRMLAWEPWNEANIPGFGGHTIDEMCALQKASFLGFKAGQPDTLVCWNVYAGSGASLHTEGVIRNEAWPYFETYNIHSYNKPDTYLKYFAEGLEGACGRPLWLTECGIRLPAETEAPWGDLSRENDIRQAEFVAKSYASSLYAGVNRHFFFILGNYIERGIQFGLLRHDLTPRPGYVALAAAGRFLAGARCLGRIVSDGDYGPCVYAFRAKPGGSTSDVLVAWSEEEAPWPCPAELALQGVWDYFGRPLTASWPEKLGPSPLYILLRDGEMEKLALEKPPAPAPYRDGEPSPVVLQLEMPREATRLGEQAHQVAAGSETRVPVHVYNFSEEALSGTVVLESLPEGWKAEPERVEVELEPMGRQRVVFQIAVPSKGRSGLFGDWVTLRGDFGEAGKPALAFRLVADAESVEPARTTPLAGAADPARWEDNIVQRASMSRRAAEGGGVAFDMQFADTDPWGYPRLTLMPGEAPDASDDGLVLTVQVLEGRGTMRVQFVEETGSAYLAELPVNTEDRKPQRVAAFFANAGWGAHSRPDPDEKFSPETIQKVLVGINAEKNSSVKLVVRDLVWAKY